MKVVINTCYGGFSISEEAFKLLNLKWTGYGKIYQLHRKTPSFRAGRMSSSARLINL